MLVPRGKKVLILPEEKPKEIQTESGIILTELKNPYSKGTVIAVSKDIESDLQPEQSVLYENNAGVELEDEGRKLLSMDESSVVFIINA